MPGADRPRIDWGALFGASDDPEVQDLVEDQHRDRGNGVHKQFGGISYEALAAAFSDGQDIEAAAEVADIDHDPAEAGPGVGALLAAFGALEAPIKPPTDGSGRRSRVGSPLRCPVHGWKRMTDGRKDGRWACSGCSADRKRAWRAGHPTPAARKKQKRALRRLRSETKAAAPDLGGNGDRGRVPGANRGSEGRERAATAAAI